MGTEDPQFEIWYNKINPGWHEYRISRLGFSSLADYVQKIDSMIDWIEQNVELYDRHTRWNFNSECMVFRFRYERDFLRFILRWS